MKFGFDQLVEKTPAMILFVGHLLTGIGASGAVIELAKANPTASAVVAIAALAGKFITEMCGEDKK